MPTLHSPNKKPLHSNHHHRSAYASIKNVGSYINIMWHYSTAFFPAYASIQPHSQSYNNIMLSSLHHSCPYQSRAVISANATHPKTVNSPPPFSAVRKKNYDRSSAFSRCYSDTLHTTHYSLSLPSKSSSYIPLHESNPNFYYAIRMLTPRK